MKLRAVLPFLALAVAAMFPHPALAWNCSDPLAARVPVATGTTGTFGDGDGQLFLGTGSEGTKGQLYECKVPDPTPQNNSSSTSSSSSSSNQSQDQKQKQNQNQTATGGNATSSGNNTSVTETTNIHNPAATAFAPNPGSTVPCFKGFSGAGQAQSFGFSFGGGRIDPGCDIRETSRLLAAMGSRRGACMVIITENSAKKAGLTIDDCMEQITIESQVMVAPAPIAPVPQPSITVNMPAPVVTFIPAPAPTLVPSVAVAAHANAVAHPAHHVAKPCKCVVTNQTLPR